MTSEEQEPETLAQLGLAGNEGTMSIQGEVIGSVQPSAAKDTLEMVEAEAERVPGAIGGCQLSNFGIQHVMGNTSQKHRLA